MSFDLNIDNYTIRELEEIFELPRDYNYEKIESMESQLRETILGNSDQDQSINLNIRTKTIAFLSEAKARLANEIEQSYNPLSKMNSEIVGLNSYIPTITDTYNTNLNLKKSNTKNVTDHSIIEREEVSYGNSFPSEFYSGIINPLKKRVLIQNLNIDTRFRDNYFSTSSTNFHFDLPIKFSKVLTMTLSGIEFPSSYYSISKQQGNNYFSVCLENGYLENVVITIPDGRYTPQSIISYLNTYVATLSSPLSALVFTQNLNEGNSGKMQISLTGGVDNNANVTINFETDQNGLPDTTTPIPLKLGWLFGFRNGVYSGQQTYTSEGLIDFSGSRYIYLVVDDYNNNVNNGFYSAFNSSLLNKNILARISLGQEIGTNTQTQISLPLVTGPRQYFGPVDIQKLNIQLLDEYGRIISLNNMDYSFCLSFQIVYDL